MRRIAISAILALNCLGSSLQAAPPGAAMVPSNTKLHVSIADVAKLEQAWKKTKLSKLFEDPKLKPFLDDLMNESKFAKLGLTWSDLTSVAGGELSLSIIPTGTSQMGLALIVDTTGQKAALAKLLDKVQAAMAKRGYAVSKKSLAGQAVTAFDRSARDSKDRNRHLIHFVMGPFLVAANNDTIAAAIFARRTGVAPDRLNQTAAYQQVLARAKAKATGELFWFTEPIGLADSARAGRRQPITPQRGPDMLKVLKSEGFTAIQGVGGYVAVARGDMDLFHNTAIYAPGPYQKSMRMLRALPGDNFTPPAWVLPDCNRFATFYLDLKTAYRYYDSYFDATVGEGEKGTFADIVNGLRDDPNGPRIDVGKEIIGRLGQRISLLSATQKPIGLSSVKTLVAIESKDDKGLAKAIRKLMENDEDVKKHTVAGNIVLWEMITKAKKKKGAKSAPAKSSTRIVAVARGQLFLASDVKFLEKVVTNSGGSLAGQADFQRVSKSLAGLGAGQDCLRSFARTDDDLQTVYELMRTNQLEKSNSLYAKILVSLFHDNVTQIDGSKMPNWDAFRPYLGPSGLFGVNQKDGWFTTGVLLRKN